MLNQRYCVCALTALRREHLILTMVGEGGLYGRLPNLCLLSGGLNVE